MANLQGPFGMVRIGTLSSAPNFSTFSNPPMRVAAGDTNAIGFGDLVTLVSGGSPTGYVTRWTAGDGTATYQVAGVFYGCKYFSTSQKKTVWNNYWPGSDATGDVDAFIDSDPNAMFMIQANSGPLDLTTIGQTSDVVMGTVNTSTGLSAMSLAAPSTSSPANLPLKIYSVVTTPPGANGTDVTTAYNNVVVIFNNQISKSLLTIHS